jgi:hypothetical protein
MTAGPCVSLPKIESVTEKPSSATHLGGPRRSLTGRLVFFAKLDERCLRIKSLTCGFALGDTWFLGQMAV